MDILSRSFNVDVVIVVSPHGLPLLIVKKNMGSPVPSMLVNIIIQGMGMDISI